jgi:hypothetical protein
METTWSVVQKLGLVVEEPESEQCLVYGSSDPYPNPAELILTQLIASRYQLGWRFFTYEHGKNLFPLNELTPQPPKTFLLEHLIPHELTLGEMGQEVFRIRRETVIVGHLPNGSVLRVTSNPFRKWSGDWASMTIHQFHEAGGWLGGTAIHFLLRLWAEGQPEVFYPCPYQEKGRVYETYRGFPRPLFVLTSFIRFIPPARMGLPEWAPAPWSYWLSLPAAFRRRVRKEVKKRIWSGERRIEIPLP